MMERPKNKPEHLANVLRGMGYTAITAPLADQILDHSDYTIQDILTASSFMGEEHIERGDS